MRGLPWVVAALALLTIGCSGDDSTAPGAAGQLHFVADGDVCSGGYTTPYSFYLDDEYIGNAALGKGTRYTVTTEAGTHQVYWQQYPIGSSPVEVTVPAGGEATFVVDGSTGCHPD